MSQLVSPEDRRAVGARLAKIRKQEGLSQLEMASALDIAVRTYQSYEHGVRELPSSMSTRLHKRFQIDPIWLMEGETAASQRRTNAVDQTAWIQAFSALDEALSQTKLTISTEKKVELIRILYLEIVENGSMDNNRLQTLMKIAS
jgi:transcriptional regulator with XRE-family HTH domain